MILSPKKMVLHIRQYPDRGVRILMIGHRAVDEIGGPAANRAGHLWPWKYQPQPDIVIDATRPLCEREWVRKALGTSR